MNYRHRMLAHIFFISKHFVPAWALVASCIVIKWPLYWTLSITKENVFLSKLVHYWGGRTRSQGKKQEMGTSAVCMYRPCFSHTSINWVAPGYIVLLYKLNSHNTFLERPHHMHMSNYHLSAHLLSHTLFPWRCTPKTNIFFCNHKWCL